MAICIHHRPSNTVYAATGSVDDIQAAIDEAIASGEKDVVIPAGIFDFNALGTYRVEFNVPATGLNIFGAGKDFTVLQMPVNDAAPNTIMFYTHGMSGGKLRISGITFKGRLNRDTSPTGDAGIRIESCTDFRVDHCSFYDMGTAGVWVSDVEATYGHDGGDIAYVSQGVVDHCDFHDIYKPACTQARRGYGYGVVVSRAYHYLWTIPNLYPSDPWTMFGKYYKNTYIEDCYFVGCRHAVTGNWAGAYVLRYSTIEDLRLYECVTTGHPVRENILGMLTCEIYKVTVRNTGKYVNKFIGFHIEGGSALMYDNTLIGEGGATIDRGFNLGSCETTGNPWDQVTYGNTKEVYIWNNSLTNVTAEVVAFSNEPTGCPAPIENVEFFLHAPPTEKNYKPYTYPHPLVSEEPSPPQTHTDELGNYSFTNIPPGIYKVSVSAAGYPKTSKEVDASTAGSYIQDFALTLTSPIPIWKILSVITAIGSSITAVFYIKRRG